MEPMPSVSSVVQAITRSAVGILMGPSVHNLARGSREDTKENAEGVYLRYDMAVASNV